MILFNNSLEDVQNYHYKLLDYDWKDNDDVKYCCYASCIRKFDYIKLFDDNIKTPIYTISGFNNKYNVEIGGIMFKTGDDTLNIVFISTSNIDDILYSLDTRQIQVDHGMIHNGYHNRLNEYYQSIIKNMVNIGKVSKIKILGHSLGGVMASILGYNLLKDFGYKSEITTFGSPKWGNCQLKKYMEANLKITNYINISDPIVYKPKNHKYVRIGNCISRNIDTNNSSRNHGLRTYRELVKNNTVTKFRERKASVSELVSEVLMFLI